MYTRKKYGCFTGYDEEESSEDSLGILSSFDQSGWGQVLTAFDTLIPTDLRRKETTKLPNFDLKIESCPIDTDLIDTKEANLQFIIPIPIAPSADSKKYLNTSSHKRPKRKRLSMIEDDLSWSLKK
jgi:hypothetical protein